MNTAHDNSQLRSNRIRRAVNLLALIAAGEAVFFLPFLVVRLFRPTFLEVFGLSNLELGTAYSVYGIVAMAAYFLGGPLADRFGPRAMLTTALLSTAVGGLASGMITHGLYTLFVLVVVCTSMGIFALRGLYFAIMKEGKIPLALTGSAVGLVSLVGYTPDVFMGPLMGYLLDRFPGPTGHHYVFWLVTGFALLGLISTALFQRIVRRQSSNGI